MNHKEVYLAKFTKENLALLKELEQAAYQNTPFSEMQDCQTWEDVADYCDCGISQLRLYLTKEWYALLAEHEDYIELVDLASKAKNTPLLFIVNTLTQYQKPFIMDCRDSTSYRIVKALEKAGRIHLISDEEYARGGELFHDIRLEPQLKQKLHI